MIRTLLGTKAAKAGAAIGLMLGVIFVFGNATGCPNEYKTFTAERPRLPALLSSVGFGAIFGGIIGGIIHMVRERGAERQQQG